MGESKHTPGPWHLVTRDGQPENGSIAVMSRSWQALYTRNALGDADADARLIAAAPLMLEALRDIVAQAERTKMMLPADLADAIRVFGRAAIKAATGGET